MSFTKTLRFGLVALVLLLTIAISARPLHAQINNADLSDAEVEQVRNARYVPSDCILLFVKFLDRRDKEIEDLYSHPRRPGREQDTHDLIAQFSAIADELSDNIDNYAPHEADLRKALPKVVQATQRWSSSLNSLPPNDTYNLARTMALESLQDLRDDATQLSTTQLAWYKAHPPHKQKDEQNQEITIPR